MNTITIEQAIRQSLNSANSSGVFNEVQCRAIAKAIADGIEVYDRIVNQQIDDKLRDLRDHLKSR